MYCWTVDQTYKYVTWLQDIFQIVEIGEQITII